jgi:23S rRNA pseudouridine2605 synthase
MKMEAQRLHKVLAQSGVGSRREMEALIEAGEVRVNGGVAQVGAQVSPGDRVTVRGRPVRLKFVEAQVRILLYHKPEGEIVSRDDPDGRTTVFATLPKLKGEKWVSVGRLDYNTSGLLIFTTSGALAHRLTHPSFEIEREYAVRVVGELNDLQMRQSCHEILLEDGPARFEAIRDQGGEGTNHWYQVVLKEGRNREVRRMFAALGCMVGRLIRVRFGLIGLPPRLKRGHFEELDARAVQQVLDWAGMTPPSPEKTTVPGRRPPVRSKTPGTPGPRTGAQRQTGSPRKVRAR